jgi:hypothetical protein
MSDYSLLFDVAKVHQADVAREAEIARMSKKRKHAGKANQLVSKLRTLLTARS